MQLRVDETLLPLLLCNNIDDITRALEKLFVLHSERFGQTHYCLNIKVRNLPLTYNQEIKALTNLERIWDQFINPWIVEFTAETGHQIYTEGRCGGYLYVDEAGEVLEGTEDPTDLKDRLYVLMKFRSQWQTLLKDVQSHLNGMRLPREDV